MSSFLSFSGWQGALANNFFILYFVTIFTELCLLTLHMVFTIIVLYEQKTGGVIFMLKTVMTENGAVRGLSGNNARISVFKGIPFAAPPVGENRWKAPQPAKN